MPAPQPDPNPLARLLGHWFHRQAREVFVRLAGTLTSDEPVDLSHWTAPMAQALTPHLLPLWQRGMLRSAQALNRTVSWRPSPPVSPHLLATRWPPQKALVGDWSLVDPRVLKAVDALTLAFCEETNATVAGELTEALAKIRQGLREGLARGDALTALARAVQRTVADPYRAFRIAMTETARATNAGQLMAAKDSGVVGGKRWLASPAACTACRLLDGREVGLDEPFTVLPKAGPYSVVLYPPHHPHCGCAWTEVLAPVKAWRAPGKSFTKLLRVLKAVA